MIIGMALFSILLGALGQFLLKLASAELALGKGVGALVLSFFQARMIVAVTCFVVSMVLWVFVLRKLELSVAYPMVSLGYVFVMLLSAFFLQESLHPAKLIGTGLIIGGVLVLNLR